LVTLKKNDSQISAQKEYTMSLKDIFKSKAAKGAAAGAAIGSVAGFILPGISTLAGGVIGGVIGLVAGGKDKGPGM
jgi:uncharacterized membrane protein